MQRKMFFSHLFGLCMFCVLFGSLASAADITTGLVADWKFDEGSGINAVDLTGGHNGAIDGATWIPGVLGSALNFNGSSDYINVPNHTALDPTTTQEITIAAWVNIPSYQALNTGGSLYNALLGKAGSPPNRESGSYFLGICNSNYGGPDIGKLQFNICYDGLHWQSLDSDSAVPLNHWVHVAFTHDINNNSKFYFDGVLQGSDSTTITQDFVDTSRDLHIGHSNSYYDYFNGGMDEVRIYNRALAPSDVLALASVPEPSSFCLLGMGIVGLFAYAWRKRKS